MSQVPFWVGQSVGGFYCETDWHGTASPFHLKLQEAAPVPLIPRADGWQRRQSPSTVRYPIRPLLAASRRNPDGLSLKFQVGTLTTSGTLSVGLLPAVRPAVCGHTMQWPSERDGRHRRRSLALCIWPSCWATVGARNRLLIRPLSYMRSARSLTCSFLSIASNLAVLCHSALGLLAAHLELPLKPQGQPSQVEARHISQRCAHVYIPS